MAWCFASCSNARTACRRGANCTTCYRRLEARGEVRGGRFVSGFSGEQFALPEAAAALRKTAKAPKAASVCSVSAVDPLNLVGIITPGEKVPRLAGNRVLFEGGVPIAVQSRRRGALPHRTRRACAVDREEPADPQAPARQFHRPAGARAVMARRH